MEIKTIWVLRFREFYRKMFKYYAIIGANVVYFFLVIGSVSLYYLKLFIQWVPAQLSVEAISSLLLTYFLMHTKVRTFVEKADVIFLLPLEGKLRPYFAKSLVYSFVVDLLKLLCFLVIFISLFLHKTEIDILFILLILGIGFSNIFMKWTEQWLESRFQFGLHRLYRFFSLYLIWYLLFKNESIFALIVMIINFVYLISFIGRKRSLNWQWLLEEEETAVLRNFRFINYFIDVPHLKRSFRKRRWLTIFLKRLIPYRQSNTLAYLYSHLFVRYNDYFYLFIRLTIIGMLVNYAFPASALILNLLILFITGFQLIPLQHEIKENMLLYPNLRVKDSFLKVVAVILFAQFFILYFALFFYASAPNIRHFVIGCSFIFGFVNFFVSKRIVQEVS